MRSFINALVTSEVMKCQMWWKNDHKQWMGKEFQRGRSIYYQPNMYMERLRKTMRNLKS